MVCVPSQASRRRRTHPRPQDSLLLFPLTFPIELVLVTTTPIIRRAVVTTNRRPRHRRHRRLLPKAPTGVWCSHLSRTRTSACSWGSTRRSSRFRSRARSERREGALGLCATRTRCHLRGRRGTCRELVSGWKRNKGLTGNGIVYLRYR